MQKVRKAVFPVAGLGTRFLPATKASPKEMLPIVDKPLIQYAVEEAIEAGITDIIFISSRTKRTVEDHFDKAYELETELETRGKKRVLELVQSIRPNHINFIYIRQAEALGLGHAVLCAQPVVGNEPFAVILADDVYDATPPALKQMVDVFERLDGPVVAVERVPMESVSNYGVIAAEPVEDGVYRITDMVEKPPREEAPSDLAIIGRYILTPDIFPILAATGNDRTGEIQLTNGMRKLLKTRPFYALEVKGTRHDTGNKLGFLKAVVHFALKRDDLAEPFREYLRGLML